MLRAMLAAQGPFGVVIVLAAVIAGAARAQPPAKPGPPQAAPPKATSADTDAWRKWLVRVEHVDRQDPVGEDAARIKELREKAAGEQRADVRLRLERRALQAGVEASRRAGFVIYGWSVHADAGGKAVDQNTSMTGFFVPYSEEQARAMARVKEGSFAAVEREGSEEVFTTGGRRFFRSARATGATIEGREWRDPPPQAADAFPSRSTPQKSPAALKELLKTSLSFVRTEQRDNGGELTRFMIDIEEKQTTPPPGRDKNPGPPLRVWVHVRAAGPDGAVIGPIIERVEVPRSEGGVYRISRSLEFITPKGAPKLEPKSVSVEPIAME